MDWLDWTDWLLDLLRNGITSQPCTYTLASSIFHIPVDSSYLIVSSRSGSRVGSCGTPIHSARLSFDVWCTHSAGETISSAEHRLRDLGKNMTFDNKPLPEVWRLSPYEGRQLRPRQIMGIVPEDVIFRTNITSSRLRFSACKGCIDIYRSTLTLPTLAYVLCFQNEGEKAMIEQVGMF